MKKITFLVTACLMFSISIRAQVITSSITHEISKNASKGELYDYYINNEKNQIELIYKLKETKKTLVLDTYLFDLGDLHFISSKEEELDKENVRKEKVKWGQTEPTKLLKLNPNVFTGNLVLNRGYISYGYAGRAVISSFVAEDGGTKVQTQAGDKFIYLTHKTESQDLNGKVRVIDGGDAANVSAAGTFGLGYMSIGEGNISIVGMEKNKPYYSKYGYTIYDAKTRSEKLYKTIDLGYSYNPISVRYLSNGDVGIVFWPIQKDLLPKTKGVAEKFNIDPDKNFKYIQINTKGEKVTDVNFKLAMGPKGGLYSIDIVSTDREGEIILLGLTRPDYFGMGTMMNPKYLATTFKEEGGIGVHKAENVVVIKIVDNKVVFKKDAPIESVINNIQATEGTKVLKSESILSSYHTYNAVTDVNGNVLINGTGLQHEVIQIDKEGNITAYTDQPDHHWAQMNELVINSSGGVYWINIDIPEYDPKSIDETNKAVVQRTGVISKLDTKGGKIEKTISLTPKGVALDVVKPVKMINENELLILGQGKKKEISLSKIVLE
jgi:hypothetical protein